MSEDILISNPFFFLRYTPLTPPRHRFLVSLISSTAHVSAHKCQSFLIRLTFLPLQPQTCRLLTRFALMVDPSP